MFVKITVKNITYYLFSNIHRARKRRITRACSADHAAHFRYVYRTIRPFRQTSIQVARLNCAKLSPIVQSYYYYKLYYIDKYGSISIQKRIIHRTGIALSYRSTITTPFGIPIRKYTSRYRVTPTCRTFWRIRVGNKCVRGKRQTTIRHVTIIIIIIIRHPTRVLR